LIHIEPFKFKSDDVFNLNPIIANRENGGGVKETI